MTEKINIAELLKDCPTGMELDCTMYDNVTLIQVREDDIYPIKIETPDGSTVLTKYGGVSYNKLSKCIIFPKRKTTWEGFVPPCKFKNGDIVVTKTSNNVIFYSIYKGVENRKVLTYVDYHFDSNTLMFNDNLSSLCFIDEIVEQRLATEDEKQELFDAIKDKGYKWNEETKTLEKLSEPKFKVEDRIKHKTYISKGVVVTEIKDTHYILDDESALPFTFQDEYDLVPNKFDITTLVPFESRVLVRHNKDNKWCGSFFSHIDGNFHSHCYKYVTIAGKSYPMCIPYEKNEHLLGTTNDCDEYFKNWE